MLITCILDGMELLHVLVYRPNGMHSILLPPVLLENAAVPWLITGISALAVFCLIVV